MSFLGSLLMGLIVGFVFGQPETHLQEMSREGHRPLHSRDLDSQNLPKWYDM